MKSGNHRLHGAKWTARNSDVCNHFLIWHMTGPRFNRSSNLRNSGTTSFLCLTNIVLKNYCGANLCFCKYVLMDFQCNTRSLNRYELSAISSANTTNPFQISGLHSCWMVNEELDGIRGPMGVLMNESKQRHLFWMGSKIIFGGRIRFI